MKSLNVLVTGGGSPGIVGTIYSLKNNYDKREVNVICTDAKDDCAGKYISDKFYQIPMANQQKKYLDKLIQICIDEKINIILPQNTAELYLLALNKDILKKLGTYVIVSEPNQLAKANNKYELLKICKTINIPCPKFYLVRTKNALLSSAKKLGWPDLPFVVKPPLSNGSRGLRIIDEKKDYKSLFYNEKPTNLFTKLENLIEIVGDKFEPLLAMEYLPGEEITIDVFRDQSHFISIPRIREEIRSGISFKSKSIKRKDLIKYSQIISDYLDLKYCFGYQFKYDLNGVPKILECNPRVQGTMVFTTFMGFNMIYSSVKICLGEDFPELPLDWDTKLIRYWGAIGINNNGIFKL